VGGEVFNKGRKKKELLFLVQGTRKRKGRKKKLRRQSSDNVNTSFAEGDYENGANTGEHGK